jgi:succinylarginine dihydrolase
LQGEASLLSGECEVQLDTLCGMTHHFGGYAEGNLASQQHKGWLSNPRRAALEGLDKMLQVHRFGVPQYVLPPLFRPHGTGLLSLRDREDLSLKDYSSAFVWSANSATVIPSADSADGKLHVLIANLRANEHRRHEAQGRGEQFRRLFHRLTKVVIHPEAGKGVLDEGAANHSRLTGLKGAVHLFVHGLSYSGDVIKARQNRAAGERIVHQAGIEDRSLFLEMSRDVIQRGIFHNDVIAFGHGSTYIAHEEAYSRSSFHQLERFFYKKTGSKLNLILIRSQDLSVDESVQTYLFNSQMIKNEKGELALLAPRQCRDHHRARGQLDVICEKAGVSQLLFSELDQSMKGGGGPACLRLRLPLSEQERLVLNPNHQLSERKAGALKELITEHYPKKCRLEDFKSREISRRNRVFFEALSHIWQEDLLEDVA